MYCCMLLYTKYARRSRVSLTMTLEASAARKPASWHSAEQRDMVSLNRTIGDNEVISTLTQRLHPSFEKNQSKPATSKMAGLHFGFLLILCATLVASQPSSPPASFNIHQLHGLNKLGSFAVSKSGGILAFDYSHWVHILWIAPNWP